MASQFSWSDSLQAVFASCLYCLQSPTDADRDHNDNQGTLRPRNGLNYTIPPPRARPDELEGLLADADSTDAETLSLHSNLGDERRRRKRRHPRKGIRLFGWDLFGRPPIHLAESDEEGDGQGRSERRSRTISSSTLDSDAAPLDASTIEHLSAARLAEATAAAEEERRRAKEERHRLRRERKELKRMAAAMAMGMHRYGEEEFEGFPVCKSVTLLISSLADVKHSGQWVCWPTIARARIRLWIYVPNQLTLQFSLHGGIWPLCSGTKLNTRG